MKIWKKMCYIEAAMPKSMAFWICYGIAIGVALQNIAIGVALGLSIGSARSGSWRCNWFRKKASMQKRENTNFIGLSRTNEKVTNLQLFYFASCPYCIKVRIALWWMKIEIPNNNILSNPEFKAELISGGGKKQVPCLRIEMENNKIQWLYESRDIIRYLRKTVSN
ncbi:MAG: glutathione S-transferase N-terminal domain-containing protein [Methylococcales bacterium]